MRMQAAELFALGHDSAAVAGQLCVSVRSVQRWHQAWEHGGGQPWSRRNARLKAFIDTHD
ncbi:helix-turn-helix domain-containing protein [Streptomyces sp. NPDC019890]|uniref:helix-turn-helix domain-containing protein n=1 Tax=Streptomyces sp. NPDC019890 TaxID=3365064 RepID=UPI00384B3643